jgi:hypothetical protein
MVTERTTEGARPAIRAKEAKDNRIRILERAFCVLGIGLRIKVKTATGIQHVIPKQIKYVWHPHIGNLVRYRVKDLVLPQN